LPVVEWPLRKDGRFSHPQKRRGRMLSGEEGTWENIEEDGSVLF